ncbi:MAG TPA: hypothetical protein VGF44_11360 [Terriglobales bacterium]
MKNTKDVRDALREITCEVIAEAETIPLNEQERIAQALGMIKAADYILGRLNAMSAIAIAEEIRKKPSIGQKTEMCKTRAN